MNSEILSLNGACEKKSQYLKISSTFYNEYNYRFDQFPLTTSVRTGLLIATEAVLKFSELTPGNVHSLEAVSR